MFDLSYAAITLTYYLLERLLKLALREKAVGLQPKPIEKLTEIYSVPAKKYGSLTIANSIECCRKETLITSEEKNFYSLLLEIH